jgi:hypothetical protein
MESSKSELLGDYYRDSSSLGEGDVEACSLPCSENNDKHHHHQPHHSWLSWFCSLVKIIYAIVSLVILISVLTHVHFLSTHMTIGISTEQQQDKWHCGNTAETAWARGCVFDVMLTTWMHKDCFYPELMESYLAHNNFNWSLDTSFTQIVPLEEIRKGKHEHIYVDPEFHYVHCAYTWEMQLKAWHEQRPLIESLADPEHSVHCSNLLTVHVLPRNETSLSVVAERCELPGRPHEIGAYGGGEK